MNFKIQCWKLQLGCAVFLEFPYLRPSAKSAAKSLVFLRVFRASAVFLRPRASSVISVTFCSIPTGFPF
jgi:hypothetical protein